MLPRAVIAALLAGSAALMAATDQARQSPPPSSAAGDSAGASSETPPLPRPALHSEEALDLPGLHNLVAFHEEVWSGSAPAGDAGFDSLKSLGVQTILSVDGALPDLDRARARGMRYVHLPIGYDGFEQARKLQLTRAVRDLPRPIYIHCHHGKHRSAGAAAAIAVSLGWLTPDEAAARMKVSGTAPGYAGLWRCAAESAPIAAALIDATPADFPERTMPGSLVAAMVEIDQVHDRLMLSKKSGWIAPPEHPDLAPLADAGRLADLYRLLDDEDRLSEVPASQRDVVREWFVREGRTAAHLETLIESMDRPGQDTDQARERASAALATLSSDCLDCHRRHRD
ncbi:MAG: hypothetical protein FJ254_05720 [Phycisphaerae bacterium]|nr:hypothetical protein [Phycisphaerae bacterium]